MDLIFSQAKGPLDVVRVAKSLPMSETLAIDTNGAHEKAAVESREHALEKRPT